MKTGSRLILYTPDLTIARGETGYRRQAARLLLASIGRRRGSGGLWLYHVAFYCQPGLFRGNRFRRRQNRDLRGLDPVGDHWCCDIVEYEV